MGPNQDSYLVIFRGRTLGPISSRQVELSVRRGELLPKDRICPSSLKDSDGCWKSVEDFFPELFPKPEGRKELPALPLSRMAKREIPLANAQELPPGIPSKPVIPVVEFPRPEPLPSRTKVSFDPWPEPKEERKLQKLPKFYGRVIALSLLVSTLSLGLTLWMLWQTKKTRDLETIPGPPSPLAEPQAPSDPVPELRAPARPSRDPLP